MCAWQNDFTDRDGRPPIWWAAYYGYEGKRCFQAKNAAPAKYATYARATWQM